MQAELPDWEQGLIDEAIRAAEEELDEAEERSRKRALQLAREQAYHRLALAIDRPRNKRRGGPGQLSLWPDDPTLFED